MPGRLFTRAKVHDRTPLLLMVHTGPPFANHQSGRHAFRAEAGKARARRAGPGVGTGSGLAVGSTDAGTVCVHVRGGPVALVRLSAAGRGYTDGVDRQIQPNGLPGFPGRIPCGAALTRGAQRRSNSYTGLQPCLPLPGRICRSLQWLAVSGTFFRPQGNIKIIFDYSLHVCEF